MGQRELCNDGMRRCIGTMEDCVADFLGYWRKIHGFRDQDIALRRVSTAAHLQKPGHVGNILPKR